MIRLFTLWFLLMALPGAAAQTASAPRTGSIERSVAPGTKVVMRLSAGQYYIRPGSASDKIRLHWSTIKPEELSRSQVNLEVQGSEAVITARGSKGLQVEIEVPEAADFSADLGKGDIDIRDVEGNKEIRCHSGDVTVHGNTALYKQADLSVDLGDIEAPPLGASKGGLLRSFHWQGSGKYTLRLSARMGSITVLER